MSGLNPRIFVIYVVGRGPWSLGKVEELPILGLSQELSGYRRWLGYCIPVRFWPPSLVLFKRLPVYSVACTY